jgi:hypothetical protein
MENQYVIHEETMQSMKTNTWWAVSWTWIIGIIFYLLQLHSEHNGLPHDFQCIYKQENSWGSKY